MKIHFQHLHLFCKNLDPMVAFWTEAMGATVVVKRKMGAADGAELSLPGNLPLYIRGASLSDTNAVDASKDTSVRFSSFDHVGFAVDDMVACLEHLGKRADVTITRPPFNSGSNLCAFIRGPEGVHIELVQPGGAK